MPDPSTWSTTVQELMFVFRESLVALTPYMDKVRIKWRDEDAYDDWDDISQVLYRNIVVRSVEFSSEYQEALVTPDYGTMYPLYGDRSFIDVAGGVVKSTESKIFVGFGTLTTPFDQVVYILAYGPNLQARGEPRSMPVSEAKFVFVANRGAGKRDSLSELLVEL